MQIPRCLQESRQVHEAQGRQEVTEDFKERHRAVLRQTFDTEAEVERRLQAIIAADEDSKLHWDALARLCGINRDKR
jgi:hypothetical protein